MRESAYTETIGAEPCISASQLALARSCLRSWAYRYIDGVRAPSTPAQAEGTRLHALAEAYLRGDGDGEPPRVMASAVEAGCLPEPGTVRVEYEICEPLRAGGGYLIGYVDAIATDDADPLRVWDHKFVADVKWALAEDELRRDPQAIVYAHHAQAALGARSVTLSWVYYRKRPPYGHLLVRAEMGPEEIREAWAPLEDDAIALVSLLRQRSEGLVAADVPAERCAACEAYGGCPHARSRLCDVPGPSRFRFSRAGAARKGE